MEVPLRRLLRQRLSTQVVIMMVAILVVTLAVGFLVVQRDLNRQLNQQYEYRSLAVAQALASQPGLQQAVLAGLRVPNPHRTIEGSTGQPPPIRAVVHARDRARVPLQLAPRLPRGRVRPGTESLARPGPRPSGIRGPAGGADEAAERGMMSGAVLIVDDSAAAIRLSSSLPVSATVRNVRGSEEAYASSVGPLVGTSVVAVPQGAQAQLVLASVGPNGAQSGAGAGQAPARVSVQEVAGGRELGSRAVAVPAGRAATVCVVCK